MNIVCIGELMIEMSHISDTVYHKTYAGDTFNVACYMKQYAPSNWNISYATAFGNGIDDIGGVEFIKSYNINTDKIMHNNNRNIGLFILSNDEYGEKQYGYWRNMSAAKTYFDNIRDFSDYDIIYFSGITGAITEKQDNLIDSMQYARQKNTVIKIVYDFNHRKQLWSSVDAYKFALHILPICDIAKISDEELPLIFGDVMTIDELSKLYSGVEFIFTKGSDGSQVWINGNLIADCPALKVDDVVDTSAAGDSFLAIYLWQKFSNNSIDKSLQNASKLAAFVLGHKGSILPREKLPQLY